MTQRSKMIAVGAVLCLVVAGELARNPVRHWYKTRYGGHPPSHGRFENPEGLAIDSQGNLYVGNQDNGEFMVLDSGGKVLQKFGELEGYHNGAGEPNPRFCRGLYIVAPEPGRVIQTGVHNLVEFTTTGPKPALVRIIGTQGSGPGQMDGPEGVFCDTNGDIYATDEHNRRINVFDKEGKYLRSFSVPQDPQCVTVWKDRVYVSLDKRNYSACYSKDGVELFRIGHEALFPLVLYVTIPCAVLCLVVLMAMRRTLLSLGLTAAFLGLAAIGCGLDFHRHRGPGEFRLPDYLLVSPDGTELFIVDRWNSRIQVTDMDGHFKRMFGKHGSAPGQLNDPKQLAFDPEGRLWVADSDNHRLQVFTREGKFVKLVE